MKKFNADQPGYDLEHFVMPSGEIKTQAIQLGGSQAVFSADVSPAPMSVYLGGGKRVFETILIILSLPFFLPLVLVCAFLVALDGSNPFNRQIRLGKNGKRFSILKLRTMVQNADDVL